MPTAHHPRDGKGWTDEGIGPADARAASGERARSVEETSETAAAKPVKPPAPRGDVTDMPAILGARYRVMRELGRGSMGQVLLVEHIHTGEHLALKVLFARGGANLSSIERFKREARAPALIRSQHVARVTDADIARELGDLPFLVMELLDGSDFEHILAERGRLPPAEVVDVFSQMAKALDKAHAIGIVHRDLKPANIFLHRGESGPVVKILDFGISKLVQQDYGVKMSEQGLTMDGMLVGTLPYMSPEQASGQPQNIGPPTDIWAMGILAFRLLTGRYYWQGETLQEILMEIYAGEMQPPSALARELPPAFDAWFARSCDRKGAARFPSAGEQAAALAQVFGVTQRSSRPESSDHLADETRARVAEMANEKTTLASTADRRAPLQRSVDSTLGAGSQERRQVTVMYCAVGAESEEADDADPEDIAEVIDRVQAACDEALSASGRLVTRPMGDGRLLYFGVPVASGDDAARAVTAGLRIIESVRALGERAPRQGGVRGWVRIGIHTGIVVVKEGGDAGAPLEIIGQAGSTAVQVQQQAENDAVTISGDTYRLIRGRFDCDRLSPAASGGRALRLEVLRVHGRGEGLFVGPPSIAAPLIGRASELALLAERFEQVKGGAGHVALFVAEPGVGKSRLVSSFRASLEGQRHRWLEAVCAPDFQSTPFHPLILVLQRIAGIDRGDSPEQQLAKLERALRPHSLSSQALPLLGDLLAQGAAASSSKLNLSPQQQRQGTFEAFLALLQEIAAIDPLCFVLEDVQWMDPSTIEFVGLLVENAPTMGLFTVLTCQPSFAPPWPMCSHLTQLTLSKLPRDRVEAMILQITEGKLLPPEVIEQIVAKTDGVPLFVGELTRTVLESGLLQDAGTHYRLTGPLRSLSIPATLRDSLTARLDRVGHARRTAQLAATFGRELAYEHIAAVSPLDEAALKADLRALSSRGLIQQAGLPPRARYRFNHTLVQEAAYDSLTKGARRQQHRLIADTLEERFPAVGEANPEVLGHHCAAAGLPERAAGYLLRAGKKSIQRSANVEAIRHLREALSLVESMPDSPERARLELTVCTTLGVSLIATKGYTAQEVEETYARAIELGKRVAESRELFPAVWGLWIFCLVRARYSMARELADQLLRLAEGAADDGMRLCAHTAQGNTLFLVGEFSEARSHLERCVELYDPAAHRSLAYIFGQDLGMYSRSFLSWTLWMLGYPDQAARVGEEAVACARGSVHANSIAFGLAVNAHLHVFRRDAATAKRVVTELVRFTTEQGLPFWHNHAKFFNGWVALFSEHRADGLDAMIEARVAVDQIGQRAGNSYFDFELVEGCIAAGRAEEGLSILDRVKQFVDETGEVSFSAERHRLSGELALILSGDQAAAEAHFLQAIEVASQTGARALGLRAATSLARLWRSRGDLDSARRVLGPIHDAFTEGFELEDLRTAKALLGD